MATPPFQLTLISRSSLLWQRNGEETVANLDVSIVDVLHSYNLEEEEEEAEVKREVPIAAAPARMEFRLA